MLWKWSLVRVCHIVRKHIRTNDAFCSARNDKLSADKFVLCVLKSKRAGHTHFIRFGTWKTTTTAQPEGIAKTTTIPELLPECIQIRFYCGQSKVCLSLYTYTVCLVCVHVQYIRKPYNWQGICACHFGMRIKRRQNTEWQQQQKNVCLQYISVVCMVVKLSQTLLCGIQFDRPSQCQCME